MAWFWAAALIANYLVALFVVVSVLRRRGEPAAMLAWIFAVITLPFLGSTLYAILGSNRIRRKASRRRRRVAHMLAEFSRRAEQAVRAEGSAPGQELPPELARVEQMGRRVAQMPATGGNEVEVYEEAEATFAALEEAIRSARRHVNLLYYIWQPDETGRHFRDLLAERARRGLACRVLLDSVGCLALRRSFTRPMVEAGVRVAFFLPLYPFGRRWTLHMRNHRKIAVIDGQVGFVGSQNIGDEYRGRFRRLSPWYDSHMRVSGPAALFLQQTFAEDWFFATREDLDREEFFPRPQPAGRSVVQILPTGPDQDISALGQLLFAAISAAQRSIRIATPYFVPDPALQMALIHAAYRGVRVEIVLPTRTDATFVLWAARSFYAELLEAGVEIYEFEEGVLHSKIITVDERWCMLGSANMDVRSFRLNFEITALVYDQTIAGRLAASIDRCAARSRRITRRDVWGRKLHQQLIEGAARLFAPLL